MKIRPTPRAVAETPRVIRSIIRALETGMPHRETGTPHRVRPRHPEYKVFSRSDGRPAAPSTWPTPSSGFGLRPACHVSDSVADQRCDDHFAVRSAWTRMLLDVGTFSSR